MAITYTVKISELGQNSGNYSVTAEVTDDTKPVAHQTKTVQVLSAKLDTVERKKAVWDNLKTQYLEKIGKADVVSALESEAKEYLEA